MFRKSNVRVTGIYPELIMGLLFAEGAYARLGGTVTVTSCNDSKHGPNSLHGKGRAADLRTKDFVGDPLKLRDAVALAVGPEFDVVLEDLDGPNEHLHLEYDPDAPTR